MPISPNSRIAALDGWRGIAILLVLIDHAQGYVLGHVEFPLAATGQHGVNVFFVLSGYLITSRLLEGDLSLKQFYTRRFFRIIPIAGTYLLAIGLLQLVTRQAIFAPGELASCVFFYRNYFHHHASGLAAHFWSLSVEEQFYLLWPPVLLFAGRRAALQCAVVGTVISTLLRSLFAGYYDRPWTGFHTEVRADALLVGCLLAILLEKSAFREWMVRHAKPAVLAGLAVWLFCCACFSTFPPLPESVAVAALIGISVLQPASRLARFLSWRPLVLLGVVSYVVYIWQQYAFCQEGKLLKLVALLIMAPFVLLLHDLVEQPMISLGRRLTTQKKLVLAEV
jgi:peptidoglycan/LPS O-acetylase OafA/YrhL